MVKLNVSVRLLILISVLINSSCVNFKNIAYFKNLPDSTTIVNQLGESSFKNPIIRPDDIININVQALDPSISQLINNGNIVAPAFGTSVVSNINQNQVVSGYLVDKNGEVEMPFIGKNKLEGMTSLEARRLIEDSLSNYIKNPIVAVRFVNYKVSIIGEVARPSTYIIPSEKLTLLEAIALAGDLTIYGKRENILLIRERDGRKVTVRLNLNSKDILNSPYFYLQPNDVVYVEPNKAKIANSDGRQLRYLGIATSVLSIILVFLIRVI